MVEILTLEPKRSHAAVRIPHLHLGITAWNMTRIMRCVSQQHLCYRNRHAPAIRCRDPGDMHSSAILIQGFCRILIYVTAGQFSCRISMRLLYMSKSSWPYVHGSWIDYGRRSALVGSTLSLRIAESPIQFSEVPKIIEEKK